MHVLTHTYTVWVIKDKIHSIEVLKPWHSKLMNSPLVTFFKNHKYYNIRKFRVTEKHGNSDNLSLTYLLQDDCSEPGPWGELADWMQAPSSLEFSSPNQPTELDLLCILTCFHIVGIGWVPQPLQSCEERKSVCQLKKKKNSHYEVESEWLPS